MSEFHAEPQHADIVIIGAGILGATIALSAARRGFSVIVIDQNTTVGFGSTSSSAGIIRVHAGDIESSLIANESVSAWKTWRDFAEVPSNDPAAEFIQCGTFILEDFNGTLDRVANVMDQARVQYSELDSAALQQAVPWIDIGKYGPPTQPDTEEFWEDRDEVIERAIHTPSSGYVADPALAAQNLADLASRLGRVC